MIRQKHTEVTKQEVPGEFRGDIVGEVDYITTPDRVKKLIDNQKLMEEILTRENMLASLKRVRANKGCPGIDGMKVSELVPYLQAKWTVIKTELLAGNYKPKATKTIKIPKKDGKHRELKVPTVIDRLIQQAIMQVLQKYIDPSFSKNSFGFRPGRSAHQAIRRVKELQEQGNENTIDIDIEKYFDRVSHDKLMSKLKDKIQDQRVLDLIRRYLNSGVAIEKGVPQGSPLSPLLANIYLDELDRELEKRGHKFVRYADDIKIMKKKQKAAIRVMSSIKKYLREKLHLNTNEAKSKIGKECEFLGYKVTCKGYEVTVGNIQKFKEKIRAITKIRGGKSLDTMIKELKPLINGWYEYFKLQNSKSLFKTLDGWTRRRLRACYWLQLKHGYRRLGEFIKQGIKYDRAYKCAYSSRGAWFNSRGDVIQHTLNNNKLKGMGLVCLSR